VEALGIPLATLGYGSGWAIVALGVVMIFRGLLLTPREAAAMERRMEAQASTIEQQNKTIAAFATAVDGVKDVVATNNSLLSSLYTVASEQGKTP
jgi:hypothetical protein